MGSAVAAVDVWRFSDLGNKSAMLNVARSLWASVQGDPLFMRRLNGWLTIFWIVMIPASIATGWVHSITYVSALSIWALVSGHWSTWQAARVEVTQQEEAEEREREPVEKKVVDAIVEQTDVAPASSTTPSVSA
jgi:hypothetical protein